MAMFPPVSTEPRGVPSLDDAPGGRGGSATWTDLHGRLWLFGGFTVAGSNLYSMNDLWEFDPSTNQWTWQGGSSSPPCSIVQGNTQCAEHGVYGTKGTPAAGNVPGGRYWAASWTDKNGKLWLYGGSGFDSIGQAGDLNDLWEFDPDTKQWTWMNGDATLPGTGYGNPGVFGPMGTPSAGNNPGALTDAFTWTDAAGNAWLFGGSGFDVNGVIGFPNNIWEFDSAHGEWAWIQGISAFGNPWIQPSVYGTRGAFASGNVPGSRWIGAAWTAKDGHLWLFGGRGFDSQGNSGDLNEQWQYDPARNEWAWMAGQTVMDCPPNANKQNCGSAGVSGTQGVPAPGNLPGGRSQFASWTGKDGHFWLMGGGGFYDFWEFDPSTNEWTWVGGTNDSRTVIPVFGTLRTPAAGNYPGARFNSVTWTDPSGNLWLFSGQTLGSPTSAVLLNDLWKYQPASAISVPGPDFAVAVSGSSLAIQSGQSATTTVSVTPSNGFDEPISFTCSGLPGGVSYSFLPASVNPSAGGVSSTLTLKSSAAASLGRHHNPLFPIAFSLAALFAIRRRPGRMFMFMAMTAVGLTVFTGCGGGTSGGGSRRPVTVTISATAGTLQHTATVELTVN
jgi:N-acetylneuraminic acid mutarotase